MSHRYPLRRSGALRLVLSAGLVCAPCALSGPCRAADRPPDPDLTVENHREAGPFLLRPFFLVKDVGYDSNIGFDSQSRERDYTATGGLGLSGLLRWEDRGGLRFFHESDYVTFRENTDLNHWNSATRARGIYLLKQAVVSLEDSYVSERERPNIEIDQRLRRQTNAITAAARSLSEGRLSASAALRRRDIDYTNDDTFGSDAAALRLNRKEAALVLGAGVRIRPKTTLTLEGVLEDIDFDDDSEGRDSGTRSFLSGFRFDPTASIQGHLKLGIKSLQAPDRPRDDTDETVGEAALSTRFGKASRLKGTFSRDLVFSIQEENLYFIDTSWSAAYEHFFSRRVSGELSYGRGTADFPNDVTRPPSGSFPAFNGAREDRVTTYRASVAYRVSEQVSLVLRGHRQERDSTDDYYDVERTFVTFGSTYNF